MMKLGLITAKHPKPQEIAEKLRQSKYEFIDPAKADVVLVIGGDGLLLHTMRDLASRAKDIGFYGINGGSYGFLMNRIEDKEMVIDNIISYVESARPINFPTLKVKAELVDGKVFENFAINEISLFRYSPQAIKMKLCLDGHDRISDMVGDGMLLATPQGSTAYNYACGGPILPLGSSLLALTPISLFRPRRWSGAVVRQETVVDITLHEHEKRPGMVAVDSVTGGIAKKISMAIHKDLFFNLLVDRHYDLDERIILEQFEL